MCLKTGTSTLPPVQYTTSWKTGLPGMVSRARSTTHSLTKKICTDFIGLSKEEMYYHPHVANVHQGTTGSKSRDVCEMNGRGVEKSVEQGLADTKAMKASYEEFMRSVLSNHCSNNKQLESHMQDVQTAVKEKAKKHYIGADSLQEINHPTSRTTIWRSYVEGPTSILKNLPMPEADTLHGYPWITVKQTVNHLLELGVGAMEYHT